MIDRERKSRLEIDYGFGYLLSVACLIEDRLGEKAFVYGDITCGQCRKAVEMANEYLEKPIEIPAKCEAERLYRRIRKLSFGSLQEYVLLCIIK